MEKIRQQAAYSGKRIVLYGPESTGKSTLSRKLTQHYHAAFIEEFARDYLQEKFDKTGLICEYKDILPIARGQRSRENDAVTAETQYLFCDTDVLETYVYCKAYFNKVPDELVAAVQASHYDLYLLLQIDVPFQPDDLRDRPDQRPEMFELFLEALKEFNKPFKIIDGTGEQRLKNAVVAIENTFT